MGLDDFEDDDELLEAEASIDPDDPLNEDLFDFPDPARSSEDPAPAGAPTAASLFDVHDVEASSGANVAAQEDPEPLPPLPQDERTAGSHDSAGELLRGADPEPRRPSGARPSPTSPLSEHHDADLDEDLFQFSEIFAGSEQLEAGPIELNRWSVPSRRAAPEATREPANPTPAEAAHFEPRSAPQLQPEQLQPEQTQPEQTQSEQTQSEQTQSEQTQSKKTQSEQTQSKQTQPQPRPESKPKSLPKPKLEPAPRAAPDPPARSALPGRHAPRVDGLASHTRPPFALPAAPAIPEVARGRALELLAVAFLLLNTALIVFAWQANSSFHDTLAEVARTVSAAVSSPARVDAGAAPVEPGLRPSAPLREDPPSLDQLPSDFLGLDVQSLELARRQLVGGRYLDARRTLYRLLAHADAAGLEERAVTEAEYLIAESWELQGRALAEAGR